MLFKLRTRMIDVKKNFQNFYKDLNCRLCNSQNVIEDQNHLLDCEPLIMSCSFLYDDMIVNHNDIYSSNLKKQLRATKLFQSVWDVWDKLVNVNTL